ncbi:hypothetical protein [Winogradskyella sp. A2]|uniref:hypothetical protein n=1 Tax=Winogradskyella sp. A2 TaxID=3366944 RepID=UPI00398C27E8
MKHLQFILLLYSFTALGQNGSDSKFRYNAFSVSPLEIYTDEISFGTSISLDINFKWSKNIFTFSTSFLQEFAIWGPGDYYFQLNTMFGREHEIANWLFIDTHTGIGLFYRNDNNASQVDIGIPLQLKLRFKIGERFSIGLRVQANWNSIRSLYTYGLLLQWNKIK